MVLIEIARAASRILTVWFDCASATALTIYGYCFVSFIVCSFTTYVLRTIESRNEVHGLKTAGLGCRLVQTLCWKWQQTALLDWLWGVVCLLVISGVLVKCVTGLRVAFPILFQAPAPFLVPDARCVALDRFFFWSALVFYCQYNFTTAPCLYVHRP